jgi:hypothetical protein
MWTNHSVPMAATGFTATDVIIGLESGSLDVNALLRVIQQHTASCATAGTQLLAAASPLRSPLALPSLQQAAVSTPLASRPPEPLGGISAELPGGAGAEGLAQLQAAFGGCFASRPASAHAHECSVSPLAWAR